jgi:hypothetical protein
LKNVIGCQFISKILTTLSILIELKKKKKKQYYCIVVFIIAFRTMEKIVELLAREGLYPSLDYRNISTSFSDDFSFKNVIQRPFKIRSATIHDIDALLSLERKCWPENIQADRKTIEQRLSIPGQYVAEISGDIVSILYTQRIGSNSNSSDSVSKNPFIESTLSAYQSSIEDTLVDVFTPEVKYSTQNELAHENGPILQLIAIASLPEFGAMQVGYHLRNHALLLASLDMSIKTVIAMTRCSNFMNWLERNDKFDDDAVQYLYESYVKNSIVLKEENIEYFSKTTDDKDPTLLFHALAGARLLKIMPKYRPSDKDNLGNAVLIQYQLSNRDTLPKVVLKSDPGIISSSSAAEITHIAELIKSSLIKTIASNGTSEESIGYLVSPNSKLSYSSSHHELDGSDKSILNDVSSIDSVIMNSSFMDLGLDSMQMVELSNLIAQSIKDSNHFQNKYETSILLSPTFLFDNPTPNLLIKALAHEMHISSASHIPNVPSIPLSNNITNNDDEFYAIVGIACNFPGRANTPENFFSLLCNGYDAISKVPPDWLDYLAEESMSAAFLDDNDAYSFDPSLFGLSINEASGMDPHHRALLKVGHGALKSAGVFSAETTSRMQSSNSNIGVFVGLSNNDYVWSESRSSISGGGYKHQASEGINTAAAAAANRLSYILGLTGPSLVVDTACSSSLAALHVACQSLKLHECEYALAASADLLISPHCIEVYLTDIS